MIESKTLRKSNRNTATYLFLSIYFPNNSVQERVASIIEYKVLKSNWVMLSRLLDNRYSLMCLYSSFSRTLGMSLLWILVYNFLLLLSNFFVYWDKNCFLNLVGNKLCLYIYL